MFGFIPSLRYMKKWSALIKVSHSDTHAKLKDLDTASVREMRKAASHSLKSPIRPIRERSPMIRAPP